MLRIPNDFINTVQLFHRNGRDEMGTFKASREGDLIPSGPVKMLCSGLFMLVRAEAALRLMSGKGQKRYRSLRCILLFCQASLG